MTITIYFTLVVHKAPRFFIGCSNGEGVVLTVTPNTHTSSVSGVTFDWC